MLQSWETLVYIPYFHECVSVCLDKIAPSKHTAVCLLVQRIMMQSIDQIAKSDRWFWAYYVADPLRDKQTTGKQRLRTWMLSQVAQQFCLLEELQVDLALSTFNKRLHWVSFTSYLWYVHQHKQEVTLTQSALYFESLTIMNFPLHTFQMVSSLGSGSQFSPIKLLLLHPRFRLLKLPGERLPDRWAEHRTPALMTAVSLVRREWVRFLWGLVNSLFDVQPQYFWKWKKTVHWLCDPSSQISGGRIHTI